MRSWPWRDVVTRGRWHVSGLLFNVDHGMLSMHVWVLSLWHSLLIQWGVPISPQTMEHFGYKGPWNVTLVKKVLWHQLSQTELWVHRWQKIRQCGIESVLGTVASPVKSVDSSYSVEKLFQSRVPVPSPADVLYVIEFWAFICWCVFYVILLFVCKIY